MSSSPQQELVAAGSRDYICPCGKSYLSYPALFTHIKQKHDGKVMLHLSAGTRRNQETKAYRKRKGETPKKST